MKSRMTLISLAVAGLLVAVGATTAGAATTEALWDFEMDSGVASVVGTRVVQGDDASGNGDHMTGDSWRAPHYSSDVSPLAPGSTVSAQFVPSAGSWDRTYLENPGVDPDAPTSFGADQSFTVETWLKIVEGAPNSEARFLKAFTGSTTFYQFRLIKSDTQWSANWRVNGPSVSTNTLLNEDQWYHLAAVRDSDNDELRIYLDGVLKGTTSLVGTNGDNATGARAAGTYLNLGIGSGLANSLALNGWLDSVRISSGVVAPGDFQIVPEPGTVALVLTGVVGLLACAWRRRK